MRAVVLLALAACSPDIATGAYLCGPEQDCPDGKTCNGPDNTCVVPSSVQPFACLPAAETAEPDNDIAHAHSFGMLDCVSVPIEISGCLAAGDKDDWFTFQSKPGCNVLVVNASVTSPIAFEPVTLEVTNDAGTEKVATPTACTDRGNPESTGANANCVAKPITPATVYALHVMPVGSDDCGGQCAFNRYTLTFALAQH